ncbi:MAG: ribonuclease HI [Calditrichia bacterium]
MKEVTIYTDGSCLGNPGPGGYCAILIYNGAEKIVSGGEAVTTNNRMEIMALIEALKALKEPCRVHIYTDSAYLMNAFKQRWMDSWKANGWQRKEGKKLVPLKNKELWQTLYELSKKHQLNWNKVAAHTGDPLNERCDTIAKSEAEKRKKATNV